MPKLAVCLLTYTATRQRLAYAEATLHSTMSLLSTNADACVHIADDGSPAEHRDRLISIAREYAPLDRISVSNSERGGYGKNVNLAMQALHSSVDYVLMLEDDWELTRLLDLQPLINALESSIGVECIRLGYLSFTQGLWGRVMSAPPEWYKYLLLDPDSDEPHVFAGHPRLETVAFQKRVGPWQEGLAPGATEFEIAHRPEARRGVAWPMDLVHPTVDPLFAHIGSVRSTEITADHFDGSAMVPHA